MHHPISKSLRLLTAFVALFVARSASIAQTPPDYNFQFATVGAPNNPAFQDPTYPFQTSTIGRGSVPYFYRISKLEITTGQWVEFLNSYANYAVPHPKWNTIYGAIFWGGYEQGTTPGGGTLFGISSAPNAASYPVGGISWYMAALYCNWLNNGKGSNPNSLISGSYDTRTWGRDAQGNLTDALTHQPGAKYWIPTLDEELKACFFDPRKNNGTGGWWKHNTGSDARALPGPPGVGQTSAGYHPEDPFSEWQIPLGAYPQTQSPWGLFDTSGGVAEWTEEIVLAGAPTERIVVGSAAGDYGDRDSIYFTGSDRPELGLSDMGFRIVSAVPAPSTCVLLVVMPSLLLRRKRAGGTDSTPRLNPCHRPQLWAVGAIGE